MTPSPKRQDPNRGNIMALLLLVVLLIAGIFLYRAIRADVSVESCIESGRRDCAPVDR
jgi:hypothetical protein